MASDCCRRASHESIVNAGSDFGVVGILGPVNLLEDLSRLFASVLVNLLPYLRLSCAWFA